MRNLKLLAAATLTLYLSACDVVSLAPLYDDDALTIVPELEGTWRVDSRETWTFTPAGKKMYSLLIEEIENPDQQEPHISKTRAEVGLVRLSGKLFMDLMSEESGMTGAPAHIFGRAEVEQDVLHVEWVDDSWMKTMLELNNSLKWSRAAHNKIVLTSTTIDLQFFFRSHAWDEEAYLLDDPSTFLRRIR
jgi:hypothetical protein